MQVKLIEQLDHIVSTRIENDDSQNIYISGKTGTKLLLDLIKHEPKIFTQIIKPQITNLFLRIEDPALDPQHPEYQKTEFWFNKNSRFEFVLQDLTLNGKKYPTITIITSAMNSLLPELMDSVQKYVDPNAPAGNFTNIDSLFFKYFEIFSPNQLAGPISSRQQTWLLSLITQQPEIFEKQIKPYITNFLLNIEDPTLDPQHPEFKKITFYRDAKMVFTFVLKDLLINGKKYPELRITTSTMKYFLPDLMKTVQQYIDPTAPAGIIKDIDENFFAYFGLDYLNYDYRNRPIKWLFHLIAQQPNIFAEQIKLRITNLFLSIKDPRGNPQNQNFEKHTFRSQSFKLVLNNITIQGRTYPEIIIPTGTLQLFLPEFMETVKTFVDPNAPSGKEQDLGNNFFSYFGLTYQGKEFIKLPEEIIKLHENYKNYLLELQKKELSNSSAIEEINNWFCSQNFPPNPFLYNANKSFPFPKTHVLEHLLKGEPAYEIKYTTIKISGIEKFIIVFNGFSSQAKNKKITKIAFIKDYKEGKLVFNCISSPSTKTEDIEQLLLLKQKHKPAESINISDHQLTNNDGNILPNLSQIKTKTTLENTKKYLEYADLIQKSPFGKLLWNLKYSETNQNNKNNREREKATQLSKNYYAGGLGYLLNTFLDNGLLYMAKYTPTKETTFSTHIAKPETDGSLNGKISRLLKYLQQHLEQTDLRGMHIKAEAEKILIKLSSELTAEQDLSKTEALAAAYLLKKEHYYLNKLLIYKILEENNSSSHLNSLTRSAFNNFNIQYLALEKMPEDHITSEQLQLVHCLHDELLSYLYTLHDFLELKINTGKYAEDLEIIDLFVEDYYQKYYENKNFDCEEYLNSIKQRKNDYQSMVIKHFLELQKNKV